jgi:hypothetical protein
LLRMMTMKGSEKTIDDGQEQPTTTLEHNIGSIVESTANVQVLEETVEPVRQSAPSTGLDEFMQRFVGLRSFALATTDTTLTAVAAEFDPWVDLLANTAVTDKTKNFAYIRGSIELEILVTAPAGCYGLYGLSFVPNGGTYAGDNTTCDQVAESVYIEAVTQVPHHMINIAAANNAHPILPFIWPLDYAPLPAGPVNMWKIRLWCYHPLTSGMNASAVTGSIRVLAKFRPDLQLVIPVQQAGKSFRDHVNEKVMSKTGGRKASEVAGTVAKYAGMATAMFPAIAPLAGPLAAGASAFASIASSFGFTRRAAENPPMPIVNRPYSNVANVDADDTGEVAALMVSNAVSIDPVIGGGFSDVDPASFAHIFSRFTLVKVLTWANTDAVGVSLGALLVSPMVGRGPVTSLKLTTAGYVGLPFEYWRGTMRYWVVIPVSKFHRGALQITWSVSQAASAGDMTNQVMNIIFDVEATAEKEFEVGFARERPVLETRVITESFPAIIPVGSACNGEIAFRVVNPLTAPNVTTSTSIFIFAAADEDMKFGVPKHLDFSYDGTTPEVGPFVSTYVAQAGNLGDEPTDVQVLTLVPKAEPYPLKDVLWGEEIDSVRALMQKPSQVFCIQTEAIQELITLRRRQLVAHFPPTPSSFQASSYSSSTGSGINFAFFNWAGWYKCLFVGIAGGSRYKLINSATGSPSLQKLSDPSVTYGVSNYLPKNGAAAPGFGMFPTTLAPYWATWNGEGYEATVPYYGDKKYELGRFSPLLQTTPNIALQVDADLRLDAIDSYINYNNVDFYVADRNASYALFHACSSDVRLMNFRFVPILTVKNTAPTYIPWTGVVTAL